MLGCGIGHKLKFPVASGLEVPRLSSLYVCVPGRNTWFELALGIYEQAALALECNKAINTRDDRAGRQNKTTR